MLWPYQWTESESVSCRLSDSRGLSSGERPPRIPGDQQGTLVGKAVCSSEHGEPPNTSDQENGESVDRHRGTQLQSGNDQGCTSHTVRQ